MPQSQGTDTPGLILPPHRILAACLPTHTCGFLGPAKTRGISSPHQATVSWGKPLVFNLPQQTGQAWGHPAASTSNPPSCPPVGHHWGEARSLKNTYCIGSRCYKMARRWIPSEHCFSWCAGDAADAPSSDGDCAKCDLPGCFFRFEIQPAPQTDTVPDAFALAHAAISRQPVATTAGLSPAGCHPRDSHRQSLRGVPRVGHPWRPVLPRQHIKASKAVPSAFSSTPQCAYWYLVDSLCAPSSPDTFPGNQCHQCQGATGRKTNPQTTPNTPTTLPAPRLPYHRDPQAPDIRFDAVPLLVQLRVNSFRL